MSELIEVTQNSEMGRYAILRKTVSAGEILFEELPFVIGPKPQTTPVCLGCCCPIDGTRMGPRCPKCEWPLCDVKCPGSKWHEKECNLFVTNKVVFQNVTSSESICMQLDCITPLR